MQTVITSKYQITIPKKIRVQLKLSVRDTLEWKVENGKVVVSPVHKKFLDYGNSIKTGKGDIAHDIALARKERAKKYK